VGGHTRGTPRPCLSFVLDDQAWPSVDVRLLGGGGCRRADFNSAGAGTPIPFYRSITEQATLSLTGVLPVFIQATTKHGRWRTRWLRRRLQTPASRWRANDATFPSLYMEDDIELPPPATGIAPSPLTANLTVPEQQTRRGFFLGRRLLLSWRAGHTRAYARPARALRPAWPPPSGRAGEWWMCASAEEEFDGPDRSQSPAALHGPVAPNWRQRNPLEIPKVNPCGALAYSAVARLWGPASCSSAKDVPKGGQPSRAGLTFPLLGRARPMAYHFNFPPARFLPTASDHKLP